MTNKLVPNLVLRGWSNAVLSGVSFTAKCFLGLPAQECLWVLFPSVPNTECEIASIETFRSLIDAKTAESGAPHTSVSLIQS
jgi:hypothetical protein